MVDTERVSLSDMEFVFGHYARDKTGKILGHYTEDDYLYGVQIQK